MLGPSRASTSMSRRTELAVQGDLHERHFNPRCTAPPRLLAPYGPPPLMCDRYDVLRAGTWFFRPAQAHLHPWQRSVRHARCQKRLRDLVRPCTTTNPHAGRLRVEFQRARSLEFAVCAKCMTLWLCTCQVGYSDVCMCVWLSVELSGTPALAG